jgi:integrase
VGVHGSTLLAAFSSLRWSELAALRKQDIDLEACTVRVTRQISYPRGGGHTFGPPKSRAGVRVLVFAALIVPDLATHLDRIARPEALVFTSPDGQPLRHSNFRRRVWLPALALLGLAGVHFNDLRHAGNKLTSDAGAIAAEVTKNARAELGKVRHLARNWHAVAWKRHSHG